MEIPNTFTVPEFILDTVRLAPNNDGPPLCSGSAAASSRLKEIRGFVVQPDIQYILAKMVLTLAQIDNDIDEHRFEGYQDVLTQQQLIGERRGLRRFLRELADIHDDLAKVVNSI